MPAKIIMPLNGNHRKSYQQRVKALFGSSLIGYWPLDETSGTVAYDRSGNGRNGTYVGGVTLGQPGMGDGSLSASFDGVNDYVNVFSAGLAAAMNGQECTLIVTTKVADIGIWSDATDRHLAMFYGDTNNRIRIRRVVLTNAFDYYYRAGAVISSIQVSNVNPTNWMCQGMTISKSGDAVRGYYNGVPMGLGRSSISTWNAAALTTATIGSWDAANFWKGNIAHVILLNRAATPAEMRAASYFRRPGGDAVAITLDDAIDSTYTIAYPAMATRGLRGTAFIPVAAIGTAGKLTVGNLNTLNAAGWDIGNHLVDELNLTTLTEPQQEAQFIGCRDYLDGLGLTRASRHVTYTAGAYNANTLTAMAATGMLTGRTTALKLVSPPPPATNYEIPSPNPPNLEDVLLWSQLAMINGSVFVFHQHSIGTNPDLSAADFATWLDFLVTNGIPAITISELYSRLTA